MDVLGLVENAPRVPRSASGPAEAFGRSTTGHGRGNSETSVHAPAAGKLVRLHTQWVLSQLSTEHARLVRAYESRESGADEQRNGSPLTQDSEPRAMLPDTAQPPASLAALVAALESACALESGTITHDDTNSASVFVSRTREEHLRECRETVTSSIAVLRLEIVPDSWVFCVPFFAPRSLCLARPALWPVECLGSGGFGGVCGGCDDVKPKGGHC